jgi:hypothetical protein
MMQCAYPSFAWRNVAGNPEKARLIGSMAGG